MNKPALKLAMIVSTMAVLSGAEKQKIPITPNQWKTEGNVAFIQRDGFDALDLKPRDKALNLATGTAVLNDLVFRDGTIEYDVQTASMGGGFGFRRRDKDTYEDFYLRPRPNCAQAPDCIQYAPRTHGVLLWDLFPQYQSAAPVKENDWNHVKLVISGRRMNVFINGASSPTLKIGSLEGDSTEGGLMFEGPGTFANLTVTPGAVSGLSGKAEKDPDESDQRYLRNWQLSPYALLADDHQPAVADLPPATATWHALAAERGGLVNISREYGLPLPRPERAVAWLKTTITSGKEQTKEVQIGWNREVWIFVNGTQVFADKNLYQPPSARKSPDGRCSLQNRSFMLPLKAGHNEIVVAIANNFYGWAVMMHLSDTKNVLLAHK